MKKFNIFAWLFLFLGTVPSTAFAGPLPINGAGATFPYPLYSKWFFEYQKVDPSTQINYQSIGSGGGIKQFTDGTVDFGASDAPLTDEQIQKLKGPALHIPTALGAVVVIFNLPDVKELKLTPGALSDIFLGKIKKWDDKALSELNPTAKLPAKDIVVVHRSDGSGTTNIFTDYLAKVSPEWKTKVGTGTAVNWPAGLGGKGNEGVTGVVKQTPGALGYVELIYAEKNHLSHADLKNKDGTFVRASMKTVLAAADAMMPSMPEDFRFSMTNAGGKDSYPIAGMTYILVWKDLMKKQKGEAVQKFLKWAVTDGQKLCEALSYAKLPDALAKKTIQKIETMKFAAASGH